MVSESTIIKNKTGLHARPAADFVKKAGTFDSHITIFRKSEPDSEVNAKSIIFLLSLGLCKGDEVTVKAEGTDEKEAVDTLIDLINSGFGE